MLSKNSSNWSDEFHMFGFNPAMQG